MALQEQVYLEPQRLSLYLTNADMVVGTELMSMTFANALLPIGCVTIALKAEAWDHTCKAGTTGNAVG